MKWQDAVALGAVQGLTEFIPVSSSAHVALAGRLLRAGDPGAAFTAVTQLGTQAAVVVAYRREVTALAVAVLRGGPGAATGWSIVAGSVPIAVLGFGVRDTIEGPARDPRLTAAALVVFSGVLLAADRLGPRGGRALPEVTWRDGLALGCWQSLALVPGVSRAGATIAGGRLRGLSRAAAARYSFLLATPAVFGSGLFELRHVLGAGRDPGDTAGADPAQTAVATAVAFGTGLGVLAVLERYLQRRGLRVFAAYRTLLGVALAIGARRR